MAALNTEDFDGFGDPDQNPAKNLFIKVAIDARPKRNEEVTKAQGITHASMLNAFNVTDPVALNAIASVPIERRENN